MSSSLDLTKTFTSFAGVDIKVILNGHHAGSMQAISYAIQREKAPIYVMGTVDPISFSRGKRGIAGTMISLMMNYHMLYSNSFELEAAYLDKGELFGEYIQKQAGGRNPNINDATQEGSLYRELLGKEGETSNNGEIRSKKFDLGTQTPNRLGINEQWISDYAESDLASNYQVAKVFYMDQILPFDVVIHAANEYGHTAQMRLFGCEILNEGSGFSIDDMVIENQMTYVCRTLLPWSPLGQVAFENMRNQNAQASGTDATQQQPAPSTPVANASSPTSTVDTAVNVTAGMTGAALGVAGFAAGMSAVPALTLGAGGVMAARNVANKFLYGGNYLDTRIDEYNRDNSSPSNLRAAGSNPVR